MKSLGYYLSTGAVMDNTVHRVRWSDDRDLTAGYRQPLPLSHGNGANNLDYAWSFLEQTSETLARLIRSPDRSRLVIVAGGEYEHGTQDDLLTMSGGYNAGNFSFNTGNLIGCVTGKVRGHRFSLHVSSRYGDEFLKYIIADADGFVEIPDHGGTSREGYEWLLIYLWRVKLEKARRLGLPKSYESRREHRTKVRGRLDPQDYARNADRGRYLCDYREHSYDNAATRLIARTLRHLDSDFLMRGSNALARDFQIATAGRSHPVQELLKTPPVRNPYFAAYNPVIDLAKQILSNQSAGLGATSRTNALLFDVSMLFEYFIRKLLQRAGVVLHPKDDRRWSVPTGLAEGFTTRKLIPDLVFDLKGSTYVFDVKYKAFDFSYGVKREDLFQLHTYIGQVANEFEVAGCGFIYPISESRWKAKDLDACDGVWTSTITQGRREIPFQVAFLMIPERGDTPEAEWPSIFQKHFKSSIERFILALTKRLQQATIQRDK